MVISTSFDFQTIGTRKRLHPIHQWVTLFQMPGDGSPYWRIVIPTDIDVRKRSSRRRCGPSVAAKFCTAQRALRRAYNSFYRVHQRVARNFRSGRYCGRGFGAPQQPLGAFGLNSGIQMPRI